MTYKFNTKLIHGGFDSDPLTGAVNVPIYQVSTYKQEAVGKHKGYEYSRTGNPTRAVLEALIAELEGGVRGLGFASGLAALSAILMLFNAGEHLIISDDVYGGTFRLQDKVFKRFGIEATYVETSNPERVTAAIRPNTKALLVETPTNPLLKITDLAAMGRITKANGMLLIVDNTFMTPYWQRPLEHGADIVWHSATKYLGGHSDVVAGLAVVNDAELGQRLAFLQNAAGGVPGPQDSYLLIRGIKTLAVRMKEHEANARQIAEWLAGQPAVKKVYYPGFPSHPGHEIHKRQAGGFGGMISFDVGSGELADQLLRKVQLFTLAESLGAVESLIELPAKMTHASIPAEHRNALGVTDGLIRISVGIEDAGDLIADLAQAMGV
ncbi:MAG: cystathionine gamma-synthase [Firmicutes bacterium]|nr:cystathionine gamma-synthase [Bacillota bacterium]